MKTTHKMVLGAALVAAVTFVAFAADKPAPKERVLRIESKGQTVAEVRLLAPSKLQFGGGATGVQSRESQAFVTHLASSRSWARYQELSADTRALADKQFALLKSNPSHSSLGFKKVGRFWSARISTGVRALAVESGEDLVWFWIGDHREYERVIRRG